MKEPVDRLEQCIDYALGRLPHWQPPGDFAARLGAAAARQSAQPAIPPSLLRLGTLLRWLTDSALIVMATLAFAALLAWGIPWNSLVQSTQLLGWTSLIALFVAGAWATFRWLPRN
jgi:hypothetical protein